MVKIVARAIFYYMFFSQSLGISRLYLTTISKKWFTLDHIYSMLVYFMHPPTPRPSLYILLASGTIRATTFLDITIIHMWGRFFSCMHLVPHFWSLLHILSSFFSFQINSLFFKYTSSLCWNGWRVMHEFTSEKLYQN